MSTLRRVSTITQLGALRRGVEVEAESLAGHTEAFLRYADEAALPNNVTRYSGDVDFDVA